MFVALAFAVPAARIPNDQLASESRPVSKAITPVRDVLKLLEEIAKEDEVPLRLQSILRLCRGAALAVVALTFVVPAAAARISNDQPTSGNRPASKRPHL